MNSKLANSILLLTTLIIGTVFQNTNAQSPEPDNIDNQLKQYSDKDTIRVNSLNEEALKLYTINTDKLKQYAEEAHEIADRIGFVKGKAESLKLIGVYYYLKSDYPKALDYYQKSIRLYHEINNNEGVVSCSNNAGVVYLYQGNYSKALEYFQESLKIFKELGKKRGVAKCYNNIGNVYLSLGDYPKALEKYQKTLKVMKGLNDSIGMSQIYNNIGIIYNKLNDYPKALDYYHKSLKLNQDLGKKAGVAKCYNNIGDIYSDSGDYLKAFENYQMALKLSKETKREAIEAFTRTGIGQLYFKQKEFDKAYDYSKRAYVMAREIGDPRLLIASSEILTKSCESLGLYKEAYETHVVYKTMNDSLFNEKNLKKNIGLEYQYKYEKEKQAQELERQKIDSINKQQKIILYLFIVGFILMSLLILVVFRSFLQKRKANRILALQKEKIELRNKKLKELNTTKDKFFSIIAHDLKSPFNVMLGFSNLLLKNYTEYDDVEKHEIFRSLNKCSEDAFRLVENLLTWSRSQTGAINYLPEKLDLRTAVLKTIDLVQAQANKKGIQIFNTIQEDDWIIADKNMLSTIFRNLISNAIKFTPKEGEVMIKANKITGENNQVITEISIKDTGIGISKGIQSKLFDITANLSTKGTENETGTGIGLVLCKEFVEKHSGEIFVESETGKGSKFVFTIPSPISKI